MTLRRFLGRRSVTFVSTCHPSRNILPGLYVLTSLRSCGAERRAVDMKSQAAAGHQERQPVMNPESKTSKYHTNFINTKRNMRFYLSTYLLIYLFCVCVWPTALAGFHDGVCWSAQPVSGAGVCFTFRLCPAHVAPRRCTRSSVEIFARARVDRRPSGERVGSVRPRGDD